MPNSDTKKLSTEAQVAVLMDKVNRLDNEVHGNGDEGMKTKMTRSLQKQDSMDIDIQTIKKMVCTVLVSLIIGAILFTAKELTGK